MFSSFKRKGQGVGLLLRRKKPAVQVWQGSVLAGMYLLVLVPALKQHREETASCTSTSSYCSWLGWVVFLHARSINADCFTGSSALGMQTLAWVSSYVKWVSSSFINQLEM